MKNDAKAGKHPYHLATPINKHKKAQT